MINSFSCVICGYIITDPVCRSCYVKQTVILLNDLNVNSSTCNFINNKLKNTFYLETLNDTECILCKKDTVTICRYCFSAILVRMLRELNFTEDFIENFEYQENIGFGDFFNDINSENPLYTYNNLYGKIILENNILSDTLEVIQHE